MSAANMSPRWAAIVTGDEADLADWRDCLKEPYEPYLELRDNHHVLRSTTFDDLESADQVRSISVALIDRLNGAMRVSRRTKPVRFDCVAEFTAAGTMNRTVFAEMHAEASLRLRTHAVLVGVGPSGEVLPQAEPEPRSVQDWSASAEHDELLDDALVYFGRATDWFDIYKALECLITRFGGEARFLDLGWAPRDQIKRLKKTANSARHARRRYDRIDNPMNLRTASRLLEVLIRRAFKEAGKS
jgi:hypothetical protein